MDDKVDLGIQPTLGEQVGRYLSAYRPKLCDECGKNWADRPGKLCPGCEAYREHTDAI